MLHSLVWETVLPQLHSPNAWMRL